MCLASSAGVVPGTTLAGDDLMTVSILCPLASIHLITSTFPLCTALHSGVSILRLGALTMVRGSRRRSLTMGRQSLKQAIEKGVLPQKFRRLRSVLGSARSSGNTS